MAGIGKQLRGSGLARVGLAKGGKAFPDLNKDGKVTFKDVLIGRGVVKKSKGGYVVGRSAESVARTMANRPVINKEQENG